MCTAEEQFAAYYANRSAEEDESVVVELLTEPRFEKYIISKQKRISMLLRIMQQVKNIG